MVHIVNSIMNQLQYTIGLKNKIQAVKSSLQSMVVLAPTWIDSESFRNCCTRPGKMLTS